MAVYTDVSEGELEAFLRNYPVGELLSYKGIAEGVENSNFLLHTTTGAYILTLYEKRVEQDGPAVLPRPDAASRRQGHLLPAAGRRQGRRRHRHAGRPAGRDDHLPRRHVDAQADGRALPRGRQGAGRDASGRPGFCADARRMRWRSTAGASCGTQSRAARRRGRAGPCGGSRCRFRRLGQRAGRRTCRRASSMPTCFPTTSSSSATSCPG